MTSATSNVLLPESKHLFLTGTLFEEVLNESITLGKRK